MATQTPTPLSPPLPAAPQAKAAVLEGGLTRKSYALLYSQTDYAVSAPEKDRAVDGLSV